jgi:hypothetical protein
MTVTPNIVNNGSKWRHRGQRGRAAAPTKWSRAAPATITGGSSLASECLAPGTGSQHKSRRPVLPAPLRRFTGATLTRVAWKDDNKMPPTEKKCHAIMDILTRGLLGPTRIISQVSSKIPCTYSWHCYRYRSEDLFYRKLSDPSIHLPRTWPFVLKK